MKGLKGFSQITKNTGYILAKAGKQKIFVPVLKQGGY